MADKENSSALVDHSVHGDGNSVNKGTSLFQEESNSVGDFRDAFAMENKRYFGLDEVISLSKNLNTTNSRIEPHNQENQTETIPNTPLMVVEHEEKKKARYSMLSSSTDQSGNAFASHGKKTETHELLAEELWKADQWRWKKYGSNQTGKKYYTCNEVEDCPAKRHVEESSKDPNRVIVTYKGQHNHPPPKS
ncbi:probable WRKY transcription factor 33 [Solanum stenotomum]|uniref:probable WRKY transcription factor 33 n=1 Tax=Solanum stenotomum TaxID=172797 RepID=UPI0020D028A6|nr:probable WRKY transcription factor 33 [Solanum stenotomum]